MKKWTKHFTNNQLILTAVLSFILSFLLITHGVFFDLNLSDFARLNGGGFIITSILVFFGLLLIEYIFDLNN